MRETIISVSLHEGTASKVLSAEVVNPFGHPLKDLEVVFLLDGEGSLAADTAVSWVGGRTDGLGRASISFNRLSGQRGDLDARLTAQCPVDAGQIRLRLIAMRPEHSK
jgi:hypothetical protein